MVRNLKKDPEDFSEQDYIHSSSAKELLQKEVDVNLEEQSLLQQRIQTLEESLRTLDKKDPEYDLYVLQVEEDRIELDELKRREEILKEKLQEKFSS